jgi:hypothetical protein
MRGLAVQRVLVKKLGGKCTYDGSMRAFSFSRPSFDLTSLGLFLAHTVAWILHIVKHYFILFPYFLIDIYSVL